jgi:hypothetical protein
MTFVFRMMRHIDRSVQSYLAFDSEYLRAIRHMGEFEFILGSAESVLRIYAKICEGHIRAEEKMTPPARGVVFLCFENNPGQQARQNIQAVC